MGGGGVVAGDNAGGMLGVARFDRVDTNDINYRVRGAISWDVRQQTEYGTLRTYIRFGAENTTPQVAGSGTTFNPFWDRAFIQFAGFTVGRSQSFFDLVTYGGAYSYHNVRVSGDTGASGQNLWAYTAQFGNGFSGTFSVEDPATRKGGTIDLATGGFPLIPATALVTDNAFTIAPGGVLNGFRVPDLIANLRVDQQWGFAGISAALHDASGGYYGANAAVNAVNANPGGGVTNGHPPTDTAGRSRAAPSSTSRAAMRQASTSATPRALRASAPTTTLFRSGTPTTAWAWAGSPTASSPTAPKSSLPGCGALSPSTSTSGTRSGAPRGSAATSTSTTAAMPPT
jgi:hypothetical protein